MISLNPERHLTVVNRLVAMSKVHSSHPSGHLAQIFLSEEALKVPFAQSALAWAQRLVVASGAVPFSSSHFKHLALISPVSVLFPIQTAQFSLP